MASVCWKGEEEGVLQQGVVIPRDCYIPRTRRAGDSTDRREGARMAGHASIAEKH